LNAGLVLPALDYTLKCSHTFNVLDAAGGIGVTERTAYILRVRQLAVAIAKAWVGEMESSGRGQEERAGDRH
jgi:glycyl-tRNA synthetase alpha subunit